MSKEHIQEAVRRSLRNYFETLDGQKPTGLHKMFMDAVEYALLDEVMNYTRGHQTKAADMLGINRNTLRKKLQEHDLL
ncbi:MAG: Fis family transcriptional regulator [Burkholderiaceae bacterium]|jgi:Fis family transcriptional regulator|nr:Fis family transcriptional regulator [Burkholderiaceae bacterium]